MFAKFLALLSLTVLAAATSEVAFAAASAASAPSCSQVCASAKDKMKRNAKSVEDNYRIWERRLGVKGEVVRYSRGYSAAEGLLDYMSSYDRKAQLEDASRVALTFVMAKCFPESYVNSEEARLPGLANVIWVARNTKIADSILTCL